MNMLPPLKRCTKCGEEKQTSEFSKDSRLRSGLRNWCKSCDSARHRRARADNPEKARARNRLDARKHSDRVRASNKAYYQKNADALVEYQRQYRQQYPDRVQATRERTYRVHGEERRAASRARRQSDPEAARQKDRNYYISNRDYYRSGKGRLSRLRRRARANELPDNFTLSEWWRCLDYWHNCCAYCGAQQDFWDVIQADHFIPVSVPACPGTVMGNMLPACKSCNSSKQHFEASAWCERRFGKRKAKQIIDRIDTYFEWAKQHP